MKRFILTALLVLLPVQLLLADDSHHKDGLTAGEIRKVDKDARKITIKHGEIKNLDMPPMTMVFQVKDPAMLDNVKAGDKVVFTADKLAGQYTVTTLQPAK
jgi:Cu/Ag efflux protein CusF